MAFNRSPLPPAEVLWRPGCPFCVSLRRGLRRAGVATVEHDIWASPAATARVRAVNGGDETVPIVIVGTQSLVNPSVRQVVRALEAEYPGHEHPTTAAEAAGPTRTPGGAGRPSSRWSGWCWPCGDPRPPGTSRPC